MSKGWNQLFRSHTERLWFSPPPMSVIEKNRDRFDQFGQPTALKDPVESTKKRGGPHKDGHKKNHRKNSHGRNHKGGK